MASKENQELFNKYKKYIREPNSEYEAIDIIELEEDIQRAIDDVGLYKKALEICCEYAEHKRTWYQVEGYTLEETILDQARKELGNEKN
ncbi:MAG: hypothetical protein KBT35_01355 [Firmicutes bacterium]|nr:hypothetical protein [Candidatus Colivicinus equi]